MESAKPRILFLLTTSDWGGVQLFIHAVAQATKKHGFEVRVAAGGEGALEGRCAEAGLPYTRLQTFRREISPFADLAALHEIRLLMRDFKPDIVHLNSSKMGVIGALAADLEHAPRVIYRIGGWSFLEEIAGWKKLIYRLAEKWTADKKDVIVTVHSGDEKLARREKIKPRGRLITIPNGIDLANFDQNLLGREEARNKLGLKSEELVVGTVANFYPAKNLPAYLATIAPLVPSRNNVRFVVLGDGPERAAIEKRREKLALDERVILAGRREDAARLLSAFDIFVLPSSKEGMPWALLEAMAASLPCIATDVGANRWMLREDREAGVIVPPHDPYALRAALEDLLRSPDKRRRLGEAARHEVETRFRWEGALNATLDLFQS